MPDVQMDRLSDPGCQKGGNAGPFAAFPVSKTRRTVRPAWLLPTRASGCAGTVREPSSNMRIHGRPTIVTSDRDGMRALRLQRMTFSRSLSLADSKSRSAQTECGFAPPSGTSSRKGAA
jgi:hypothetical protein